MFFFLKMSYQLHAVFSQTQKKRQSNLGKRCHTKKVRIPFIQNSKECTTTIIKKQKKHVFLFPWIWGPSTISIHQPQIYQNDKRPCFQVQFAQNHEELEEKALTLHVFDQEAPNTKSIPITEITSIKVLKINYDTSRKPTLFVSFEHLLEGKNTTSMPKKIASPRGHEFVAQIFPTKRQQHPNAGSVRLQLQQLWNVDTSPQFGSLHHVDHYW